MSVAEEAYLALPRGGMHELHVLIVPIQCISSRCQLSVTAIADLDKYETAVDNLLHTMELSSIKFER